MMLSRFEASRIGICWRKRWSKSARREISAPLADAPHLLSVVNSIGTVGVKREDWRLFGGSPKGFETEGIT